MPLRRAKRQSTKRVKTTVWSNAQWTVVEGKLVPNPGRPRDTGRLFQAVGEKLPYDSLADVKRALLSHDIPQTGVYAAHDSMGYPRYIGRGNVFWRLKNHRTAHPLELVYFSFYIVLNKDHEREIETLLIRAAGPLLAFNSQKKRVDIRAGNIRDFEAGTRFYERHYKRGRKRVKRRAA